MSASPPLQVFTLGNRSGLQAKVTNFGGTLMALRVPDRRGNPADIVLGFDQAADYQKPHPYFGALIGRYANRIAGGRFELDGAEYVLSRNEGANQLHGGFRGFDKVIWTAEMDAAAAQPTLRLTHTSPEGDEGFPGELRVQVTYNLTDADELRIDYKASTDRPTVVSLTQHSYFNLAGHDAGPVLDHELFIDADQFTPVGEGLIPTGEIRSVEGTPFDFRKPTRLGDRIRPDEDRTHAYDHNFVLNGAGRNPRLVASVFHPGSGRRMDVLTTEPGLQLYTGNGLDGSIAGKAGARYGRFGGLCLETQAFPDSPNQSGFPAARVDPETPFRSTTIYRFSV